MIPRRVVTAISAAGKAVVQSDGRAALVKGDGAHTGLCLERRLGDSGSVGSCRRWRSNGCRHQHRPAARRNPISGRELSPRLGIRRT